MLSRGEKAMDAASTPNREIFSCVQIPSRRFGAADERCNAMDAGLENGDSFCQLK